MVPNVHLFLIEGKAQNTSPRLKTTSLLKAVVAKIHSLALGGTQGTTLLWQMYCHVEKHTVKLVPEDQK